MMIMIFLRALILYLYIYISNYYKKLSIVVRRITGQVSRSIQMCCYNLKAVSLSCGILSENSPGNILNYPHGRYQPDIYYTPIAALDNSVLLLLLLWNVQCFFEAM